MKFIREAFIDWEPLHIRLACKDSLAARKATVRRVAENFVTHRNATGVCRCDVKSLDVTIVSIDPQLVEVACEWMCEKCLDLFREMISREVFGIDRMTVGSPLSHDVTAEFRHLERSRYLDIGPKTVEFEDGTIIDVERFTIGRWPVTVGQFERFVSATEYLTRAERNGEVCTFRENPVLVPFAESVKMLKAATCVCYEDALEYCRWSRTRLPTEAEWLAASLIDDTVYDEERDEALLWDKQGSFALLDHPDALESLGTELVTGIDEPIAPVVRWGPQYVRYTDWRECVNREVCGVLDYDMMMCFRVVR